MEGKKQLISESHGGDIYRGRHILMDFSVNVNPLGPQPEVIEAVREAAPRISCYPDMYGEELVKALAGFEQVPEDYLICTNGAAELFYGAVLALKPKKALLLSPTFSEYERALKVVDASVHDYVLKETENFLVTEDFLEHITPDMDMVFLCNPNNPTGQSIPKELAERIAVKCRECGSFLVMDECFVDFLDSPARCGMKERLGCYPGLLIVKALTKLFSMPGLRLGYGMCSDRALLCRIRDTLQSWNVSVLAQAGGVAALKHCGEYLKESKKRISRERAYLIRAFEGLGYKVYGSEANYLFFRDFAGEERNLYQMALDAGILIRDCSDYRGLCRGYYRIAVRTRPENERMVAWLRQL